MSIITTDSLFILQGHRHRRLSNYLKPLQKSQFDSKKPLPFNRNRKQALNHRDSVRSSRYCPPKALNSSGTAAVDTSEASNVTFRGTFDLKRPEKLEGKITIRLESGKDKEHWSLTVGCTLPGKWALHWGVNHIGDSDSEWDQPHIDTRPPGSIPIKDYAVETPLERSPSSWKAKSFSKVKIDFSKNSSLSAIKFVLKDEESGCWYQHKGRDFKVPLVDYLEDDENVVGSSLDIFPGPLGKISNMLLQTGAADPREGESKSKKRPLQDFYVEYPVFKEIFTDNSMSVSVRHCKKEARNELYMETDIPGDVVLHWGVCRDEGKIWEVPEKPYPPQTITFKNKALQTRLKRKKGGRGSWGSFTLSEDFSAFVFVLKLNDTTWLNCKGDDFYIPFTSNAVKEGLSDTTDFEDEDEQVVLGSPLTSENPSDSKEVVAAHAGGIINEINKLVTAISTEKSRKKKSRKAQEVILQEIEKLAAEAFSIFRSSTPIFTETGPSEDEGLPAPAAMSSGTGSGYEILCQGFNWESHKSGRWYMELHDRAAELASLGFTVIWLPPPTDSVSPEGYMPRDLYNLNSRYGDMNQLKKLVKRLHEVKIKVLGDVVLNHRCAQFQNQNGVWNIFGGRLNWDDRAVVCDDPHFQGRGNKSSGDSFHAAPNIDHSQEFVRKDIKEWLCWLRKEIGYDGWRLDFARGFWGGYVKDYLDASDPYFAVGEFWDSLSYTYGEMDRNQDAHRQRIVDWINATNGASGAFDVTTKGVLHTSLERCEYWRLADEKGKPTGVVGWWPSRAVTFIENHDTGSTQGHWRFPGGKEMQGYAYTLTHPGTPSVFYDHIFSDYKSQIAELISIRKRKKIHCRSVVKIMRAENDVYAAMIDEKLSMKIGPGHYEPSKGPKNWSLAMEGRDYKVWEAS